MTEKPELDYEDGPVAYYREDVETLPEHQCRGCGRTCQCRVIEPTEDEPCELCAACIEEDDGGDASPTTAICLAVIAVAIARRRQMMRYLERGK